MTSILKYKNINTECIKLCSPVKGEEGVYSCDIYYEDLKDNGPLYIQTPILTLNEGKIAFSHECFEKCMAEIYDRIVLFLVDNSSVFFKGKTFSANRIKDSLENIVLNENEIQLLNTKHVSLSDKVKVIDIFGDDIDIEYPMDAHAIIHVKNAIFKGKEIILDLVITHLKKKYPNKENNPTTNYIPIIKDASNNGTSDIIINGNIIEDESLFISIDNNVNDNIVDDHIISQEDSNCDNLDFFITD